MTALQTSRKNGDSEALKGLRGFFVGGECGLQAATSPTENFKRISLTRGKFAKVDCSLYEKLKSIKWTYLHQGYATHYYRVGKKVFATSMHRFIMNPPPLLQIDHINGDGLDNRKDNLRLATHKQNLWNSCKKSTNAYKGVYGYGKSKNRFYAQIMCDGIIFNLGHFDTEKDAALAYDRAAIIHFGEFARLNFPHTNSIPSFFSPRNFTKKQSENLQLHRKTI